MDVNIDFELVASPPTVNIPVKWDQKIARWISRLLSPPILALLGISLVIHKTSSPLVYWWAGFYVLLVIIIPVLYIAWKVRRGEISNFFMRERSQRIRPMVLMLVCSLVAWGIMLVFQAPTILILLAAFGVLEVIILLLITLRWKISGHGTAIGGMAVFLWLLYGGPAIWSILAVPAVAWSRVHLKQHTLKQTIAGSFLGILSMGVMSY